MEINIAENPHEMGLKAGELGAHVVKDAIANHGAANIILATGTSQFDTMNTLIADKEIDWSKVVMFHLDEYIGLPVTHKASFRRYLKDRFLARVPDLKAYHLIDGEKDPQEECNRLNDLIGRHPIDVAFVGIGENGHLAFNDPPADFETTDPYIVVQLDEACRAQQMGEGWFPTLQDVPDQAISMSVHQIMASDVIICSVPDERKAKAVALSLTGEVTPLVPASILQNHEKCHVFLDEASAKLYAEKVNS